MSKSHATVLVTYLVAVFVLDILLKESSIMKTMFIARYMGNILHERHLSRNENYLTFGELRVMSMLCAVWHVLLS